MDMTAVLILESFVVKCKYKFASISWQVFIFFHSWAVMLNILIIFKSNNDVQTLWDGIKHSSFFTKFQLEVLKTAVSSPHNPAFGTFCKTFTCLLRFKISRQFSKEAKPSSERNIPLEKKKRTFFVSDKSQKTKKASISTFVSLLSFSFVPSFLKDVFLSWSSPVLSLLQPSFGCCLLRWPAAPGHVPRPSQSDMGQGIPVPCQESHWSYTRDVLTSKSGGVQIMPSGYVAPLTHRHCCFGLT